MGDRTLSVSNQDFNTIIAALAFYREHEQGEPANRTDEIHELACGEARGMDEDISLDDDGIRELIERLMKKA